MTAPVVLQVHIPGEPVAKGRPRMTRQGRAYTPKRTASAETYARQMMVAQAGQPLLQGPLDVEIVVVMGIPQSWKGRTRADAVAGLVRPTKRPDADNFGKLYGDAGNGILWHDDSQICGLTISKCYGEKPGVLLTVRGQGIA